MVKIIRLVDLVDVICTYVFNLLDLGLYTSSNHTGSSPQNKSGGQKNTRKQKHKTTPIFLLVVALRPRGLFISGQKHQYGIRLVLDGDKSE